MRSIPFLIKFLLPYLRPHKGQLTLAILFSIFLAGIKGLQAYLIRPIFDKGFHPDSSMSEAYFYAGLLVALTVANFPIRLFHFYWLRGSVDKVLCQIRARLYAKIQSFPLSHFSTTKSADYVSLLLNDAQVFSLGLRAFVDYLREPLVAIVMFGLALYHDWPLTLLVFSVFPLFIAVYVVMGKKIRKQQESVQENITEVTHLMTEGIAPQVTIKSFQLQKYVQERFQKQQEKFLKSQLKSIWLEELSSPLVEIIGSCAFALVIIVAFYRIKSGYLSVGGFVSFVTAVALFMEPIKKFSEANVKLEQAGACGGRIQRLFDQESEKNPGNYAPNTFEKAIEIKNLSFIYPLKENTENKNILEGVNLVIPKGKKIALVGPSGSGKSTLLYLLMGLYPVPSDSIFVDGVCLNQFSYENLRKFFSYVGQEIFLFHDSIEENIVLGEKFETQKYQQCLEKSNAWEFIKDFSLKNAHQVGERGASLSGGQKQRLAIARSLFRDSPIFLFDEATSALDNNSEKIIQEAMDSIDETKTVVAVAHRLSTISHFDYIYVFDQGKILEEGSHEDLLARGGLYKRLYELGTF